MRISFPDTATTADLAVFGQEFALLLQDCLDGAIEAISISRDVALPSGLRLSPNPNTDVEEGALFVWGSLNGFTTKFRIPTFSESLISPNSINVAQGAAPVSALATAIIAGLPSAPTADPSTISGDDIVLLRSATESFQRSRRRRR